VLERPDEAEHRHDEPDGAENGEDVTHQREDRATDVTTL
jgi:hypothetical protein